MRVEKTIENAKNCLCLKCPSYTTFCKHHNKLNELINEKNLADKSHFEMMFCAFEKSACIHENNGCLCLKCPVHKKYELNNEDYCLNNGGVF